MKLPDHIDLQHPMLRQAYAVFTPPIQDLVNNIADWIDQQETGAYIYGPSRFGKTTAIQNYLRDMLIERFGRSVPLVIWNRPYFGGRLSEGRFWRDILRALNCKLADQQGKLTDVYRDQVLSSLMAEAIQAHVQYVVLVIDEGQAISDEELQWLLGLQNELTLRCGIRLTVILVGAHQIGYVFSSLAMTSNRHLAARFLSAYAPFNGLRSAQEIEFALAGYDEDSEWPPSSGTTYTSYFAPEAYARGFRLSDSADLLWQSMIALLPSEVSSVREFPMKHVALSAERALKDIALGVSPDEAVSRQAWIDRLDSLRFSRLMSITVDIPLRKKPGSA